MTDLRDLKLAVIQMVEAAIGAKLSTLTDPVTQEEFPAVYDGHQETPKANLPYVVVNYMGSKDFQGWLYDLKMDENGVSTVETHRLATYRILIYGEDSSYLAEELSTRLEFSSLRKSLRDYEASLFDKGDVMQVPTLFGADNFNKNSYLDLVINYKSQYELDEGYFDSSSITGTLKDVDGSEVCSFTIDN